MSDKTSNLKAVIYARVSSKEQEETGYSLEAQIKLLETYAELRGYKVVKIFRNSESASGKIIRKTFTEMLNFVNKNSINVLLCEKIDRLTRNPRDAGIMSDWIRESKEREVHFVKESFVVNNHTRAHENLVWDMKVAIAHFYINNLSEEVRKGQAEKIRQGWLPTKPPLGYKTIGDKGHKIHTVDTDVAPYIKELFALCATKNYSLKALEEKMYQMGLRSRSGGRVVKSRIHEMILDPMYYGSFRWKGQIYKGKHEPIINKDLYEQAVSAIRRDCSPYKTKIEAELRGKIFCDSCSKTITWERQKGHSYGGCKQCKAQIGKDSKYIRQDVLEDILLERMVAVAPKSDRVLEILERAMKESHSEEIELYEAQYKSISNQLDRIQQRMRVMYDDKLDGRITAEFYDDKLRQFTEEKEVLVASLGKLEQDNTNYYRVGMAIHELALLARKIYESNSASIEERRLLLSYAFSNIKVIRGKVKVEYTKAFNFLFEWMPKVNQVLEPEKTVDNKRQKTPFGAFHPILLRTWDDVREAIIKENKTWRRQV